MKSSHNSFKVKYMKYKMIISWILAGLLFVLQLSGIVAARFTDTKYFCWAPYDEISLYTIEVTVKGKELTWSETAARYRISPAGRENRSIHNIISIVRQYEKTFGRDESATVNISFLTNGYRKGKWTWPEDDVQYEN